MYTQIFLPVFGGTKNEGFQKRISVDEALVLGLGFGIGFRLGLVLGLGLAVGFRVRSTANYSISAQMVIAGVK